MKSSIIKFIRQKDYKFIKEIGQGGTGKTVLLKDEFIDEYFVCKKYSPFFKEQKADYFKNFIDEIRILHKINHPNIVRVYSYYLYPEVTTGYILMEYIDGENISNYIKENPDKLDIVFFQIIHGFMHLELINILHRDIRPNNFLIDKESTVKIIDFGFGKKINFDNDFDKSISLNWLYSQPDDFKEKIYDFKTEIYFIGKLIESIIIENNLQDFSFSNLLSKMVEINPNKRIQSFFDIQRKIMDINPDELDFSEDQKNIYQNFASKLSSIFGSIQSDASYETDLEKIIKMIHDLYRNSMLEKYIQAPNALARCFIKGNFHYYKNREIDTEVVKKFVDFIKSLSVEKKKIVFNNLWQRLDMVKRINIEEEDLPF